MPNSATEELERPAEWLDGMLLPGRLQKLGEEAGGVPIAAYRLARARCCVTAVPTTVPTLREVAVAARAVSDECGVSPPSDGLLLDACTLAGLVVIEPMNRRAA
ncbi:MAG TPA: hypothetical protein VHE30_13685 [Polyangiaceae bacterium]|nr:hypothetical protein [Polyangiaceae bacterium]